MLDIISFIFKFIHSEPHQVWTSDLNSKSGSMIHNNNGHPGKMNMELRSSSYYRDTQLSCAFGEKKWSWGHTSQHFKVITQTRPVVDSFFPFFFLNESLNLFEMKVLAMNSSISGSCSS